MTRRLLAVGSLALALPLFAEESSPSLAKARELAAGGRRDAALKMANELIEKSPTAEAHVFRATLREEAGAHAEAVKDYDAALKEEPKRARWLHERGVARFFAGDFSGSVADFDAFLVEEPGQAPHHWQRGLSLYCAGRHREGRKQFEDHQTVNPADVENAAWHFNCVARQEGVEAARKALIPIEGDARVPLAEVHALYAGKGDEKAVLEAAEKGDGESKRNQLCYAHLYLGLYHEALGNRDRALDHYRKAAKDFSMKHYMGETARVLFESRTKLWAK